MPPLSLVLYNMFIIMIITVILQYCYFTAFFYIITSFIETFCMILIFLRRCIKLKTQKLRILIAMLIIDINTESKQLYVQYAHAGRTEGLGADIRPKALNQPHLSLNLMRCPSGRCHPAVNPASSWL